MNTKYLGEEIVDVKSTPYAEYGPNDWALHYILKWGGMDGSHHKDWVLDQIVRILNGTEMIVSLAKWDNGQEEYRHNLAEPTQQYWDWVRDVQSGEDGPETYGYEFGIAP